MKISNSVEIKAVPEKVFHWLADPERAMKWMTSVTKTEIIDETPEKVGTTFREYIEENGRGMKLRGVVTDFNLNKRLAFHLESDYNTTAVNFNLVEKGESTRVIQNAEIHFKGRLRVLSIFFGFFIKRKILRQTRSEFSRLKALCEEHISL